MSKDIGNLSRRLASMAFSAFSAAVEDRGVKIQPESDAPVRGGPVGGNQMPGGGQCPEISTIFHGAIFWTSFQRGALSSARGALSSANVSHVSCGLTDSTTVAAKEE